MSYNHVLHTAGLLTNQGGGNGKGERVIAPVVLVVDDEPGLLRLFSGLAERQGCETLTARGGVAALDLLDETTPDVIVLDLAMPDVSGFDVLRHIRQTPRLDHMKVMILTARPNKLPEIETLGIDAWVTKPIMPGDFLDALNELLVTT